MNRHVPRFGNSQDSPHPRQPSPRFLATCFKARPSPRVAVVQQSCNVLIASHVQIAPLDHDVFFLLLVQKRDANEGHPAFGGRLRSLLVRRGPLPASSFSWHCPRNPGSVALRGAPRPGCVCVRCLPVSRSHSLPWQEDRRPLSDLGKGSRFHTDPAWGWNSGEPAASNGRRK